MADSFRPPGLGEWLEDEWPEGFFAPPPDLFDDLALGRSLSTSMTDEVALVAGWGWGITNWMLFDAGCAMPATVSGGVRRGLFGSGGDIA